MLSIGKIAVGQADYYLEQADGPTTRTRAVASGVEDYYLGGLEPAGEWIGDGAALLGLRGEVDGDELHRVLAGEHPATGLALGRWAGSRVPGFDLTFSAPKSVSVLFGIGDEPMRRASQAAHDVAVADAFGYVERHAAATRRARVARTRSGVAGSSPQVSGSQRRAISSPRRRPVKAAVR
jgi:conjugative relaxase-like TrwC/TraI family protein